MNQKSLILTTSLIALLVVAGAFWCIQKRQAVVNQPVVTEPVAETPVETESETVIDTSDWQTYRNEKYGFEFKYPKEWTMKEFITGGIGLPADCTRTPQYCKNFGVSVTENSDQVTKRYVVLEVDNGPFERNTQTIKTEERRGEDTWTTWEKSVDVRTIVKKSSYFPIFGSCWVTANPVPYLSLKKGEGYHFYTLYEVSGDLYVDEFEKYCSQEVTDLVFDNIVASMAKL